MSTKIKSLAFAMLALGTTNLHAEETRRVYTPDGIVQFVPEAVTADRLAELMFPGKKPLTRSVFDDRQETAEVSISVAMLIRFEFDSDVLTSESMDRLDKIGKMMSLGHLAKETLLVEGHTDIIGSEQYNIALSVRRAVAVKEYLISEHKIDSDRLQTAGRGEASLIDLNNPKGSINRRVQFGPGS